MEEKKNKKTKETEEVIEEKAEQAEVQQEEDYKDKWLRLMAEYDNYRKRTIKEKDMMYSDGIVSAITDFLPLIDNIDRCVESSKDTKDKGLLEGIELIRKQAEDVLSKLSIESIDAVGEIFNPDIHNAVMHIEDDEHEPGTVVEEFQKGYKMGDRVIRYSMVKVAN